MTGLPLTVVSALKFTVVPGPCETVNAGWNPLLPVTTIPPVPVDSPSGLNTARPVEYAPDAGNVYVVVGVVCSTVSASRTALIRGYQAAPARTRSHRRPLAGYVGSVAVALEMRQSCERCAAQLTEDGEAWICSYECTFCSSCNEKLNRRCPNCGGELVLRPRRSDATSAMR